MKPPPQAESLEIVSLAHDGRGVARAAGKAVFVDGALPGETVLAARSRRHRRYDEATLVEVLVPSPDRVVPRCDHFGTCGGCALQHLEASRQLGSKQAHLAEQFARLGPVEPESWLEPLRGPLWGYRRRARLGVKYVARKGRVLVGFRERSRPFVADVRRCPVLVPPVDGLIGALADLVGTLSSGAVYEINVLRSPYWEAASYSLAQAWYGVTNIFVSDRAGGDYLTTGNNILATRDKNTNSQSTNFKNGTLPGRLYDLRLRMTNADTYALKQLWLGFRVNRSHERALGGKYLYPYISTVYNRMADPRG